MGTGLREPAASQAKGIAGVWPIVAFLFGALATVLPILNHHYLPLVDLPNHIARLYIAAAAQDGPLSTYYSYSVSLVPNSAADMIWHLLSFPGDPVRFAQLLMAVYAVNLIASAMVLSRVIHGRWTVWSAASALLVYSAPFFWGFQNFVISLPFCLYGLALWLAMEDTRWQRLRVTVFVLFAALLYFMHFFAFAILAIAIFGREIQRGLSSSDPLVFRGFALSISMLPFIIPVLWLAITLIVGPESPGSSRTEFGGLQMRFWALVSPLAGPNRLGFGNFDVLSVLGSSLLLICLWRLFCNQGPRLKLDPRLKGPLIALAVAAALAPFLLNGVAHVQVRVPVVLVLAFIAGTSWHDLPVRHGVLLALSFAVVVAGRGVAFDRNATDYEADIADLTLATDALPAGSRVLALRAAGYQWQRRHYHMQALLVPMRKVFVPTLFQGTHALKVHERWEDYAQAVQSSIDLRWLFDPSLASHELRPTFIENWESKFTHAILLDDTSHEALDDPRLAPLSVVGRFTLYEVLPQPNKVALNSH